MKRHFFLVLLPSLSSTANIIYLWECQLRRNHLIYTSVHRHTPFSQTSAFCSFRSKGQANPIPFHSMVRSGWTYSVVKRNKGYGTLLFYRSASSSLRSSIVRSHLFFFQAGYTAFNFSVARNEIHQTCSQFWLSIYNKGAF